MVMTNDLKRIQNHHGDGKCSKKRTTWYMDNPNLEVF